MVVVALVQAGSVIYDTRATLDKVREFTAQAAGKGGAQLVLFPEAFVGGYPKGCDFGVRLGGRSDVGREEFERYFNGAVEWRGPESDEMASIAADNGVYLVVGVVEKEGSTLYCSVFFYSPDGAHLGCHRKVMPTALERVVWGCGDGSTMPVLDTSLGRMGAVICWENYMPLLRTAMYAKGIQLYLAPTVDDRDNWLSTMRTIALEGRCYVLSACQHLTASAFPPDHPLLAAEGNNLADPNRVIINGGSCAVSPLGRVLLEPVRGVECVNVVECDMGEIVRGKFDLDLVGHYARPDIFQLHVNESRLATVTTSTEAPKTAQNKQNSKKQREGTGEGVN